MIAVIQRVSSAAVWPKDKPDEINHIGPGLCLLLGIAKDDTEKDAGKLVQKIAKLRIFSDEAGKMNHDIQWSNQEVLLISQFTLISDIKGQNRPSFIRAADPEKAKTLFDQVVSGFQAANVNIKSGFFGEYMEIDLKLDGPVTIVIDTQKI